MVSTSLIKKPYTEAYLQKKEKEHTKRYVHLETDALVAIAPGERIIGYVTVWRPAEEPHRMVASLDIHPDFHGRGLGTWMLQWAELRAGQIAETLPPDQRLFPQKSVL